MTWTRARQKKEHSVVYDQAYSKYQKILKIVKSCTTLKHIETSNRITEQFENWCKISDVPESVYVSFLKSIRYYIKDQSKKIRLS